MKNVKITICLLVVCMMVVANFVSADTIQGIEIDFVTIGNAGNAADTTGYGAVDYNYRIGKYEVTNAQWNAFTAAAGVPTGNPVNAYDEISRWTGVDVPTNQVSWHETAQFCNYLTSGNKSLGAYQLGADGSIIVDRAMAISTYGTVYVIPTEDEWYKAAYYKPDGSGYSLYANGLNTIPLADNGWNYRDGAYDVPWNVGTGAIEQNSTFDMMGNVWEWTEMPNGSDFVVRGGCFDYYNSGLSSSFRFPLTYLDYSTVGFRVASVPEPTTIALLGLGGLILRRKK